MHQIEDIMKNGIVIMAEYSMSSKQLQEKQYQTIGDTFHRIEFCNSSCI